MQTWPSPSGFVSECNQESLITLYSNASPAPARVEVQRVDAALVTLEFEGEREARDKPDLADPVVHELGSASAE